MNDLTVIYYTGHREKPDFEARIQKTLLETIGDLPLISVSQKPINLGKNICVGEHGTSCQNAWRQFQIGAKEAKTKFVCTAESDSLYPKEYFTYVPESEDTFCLAVPIYVLFTNSWQLYPKFHGHESAMIVGREFLIDKMNEMFYGKPVWRTKDIKGDLKYLYLHGKSLEFPVRHGVVSIKTPNNMHRSSPVRKGHSVRELPGWGKIEDIRGKYL